MTRTRYIIISFLILIIVVSTSFFIYQITGPQTSIGEEFDQTYLLNPNFEIEEFAVGLEVPWSIVFLDNNTALVAERPGKIRIIQNETLLEEPYLIIDTDARGEGGLMGIEKHPDFPNTPYIY